MIKSIFIFVGTLVMVNSFAQSFTDVTDSTISIIEYGTGEYGGGVSFVDFNLDGFDDLFFCTGGGENVIRYQNDNGDFENTPFPITNITATKHPIWVDQDNDGDLDLYLTSDTQNKLYENIGNDDFIDISETSGLNEADSISFGATWFDYNNDEYLDLLTTYRAIGDSGRIILYKNLGNDSFENVTEFAGLDNLGNSVLVTGSLDYNNDGYQDLYIGQDFLYGNILLRNNGNGTFQDVSIETNTDIENNSMSITVGDFNNDSWMDIYVTNTEDLPNTFLINDNGQAFIDSTEFYNVEVLKLNWGSVFLDADNDIDLDLIVSSEESDNVFINSNNYSELIDISSWGMTDELNSTMGLATADFNNDGRVDVVKSPMFDGNAELWKNDIIGGNYITIDLEGTISNSFAVGAVIEVEINNVTQYKRIGCGDGSISQSSYSQIFGLGNTLPIIDRIKILWPSNTISEFYNIPGNQRIRITELGLGCLDSTACNYDYLASVEDFSCVYDDLIYNCIGECKNDSDNDGICNEYEIEGCADTLACNYNMNATDHVEDSCSFPQEYYDCLGVCISDFDNDGVCNELEIWGCLDSIACNYDSTATEFAVNSCIYPVLFYNCDSSCVSDVDNDGVCDEFEIQGCVDSLACNFDVNATDSVLCGYNNIYVVFGDSLPVLGLQYIYEYQLNDGSSYDWNVLGGEILFGQGTSSVIVNWLEEGVGIVSVLETNSVNCIGDTAYMSVEIISNSISEIEDVDLMFFPNPCNDYLEISSSYEIEQIQVYSAEGSLVKLTEIRGDSARIDTNDWHKGTYVVKVVTESGDFSKSVQKQ